MFPSQECPVPQMLSVVAEMLIPNPGQVKRHCLVQ